MYDQGFYDVIRHGAQLSADTAAPIIANRLDLPPNSTILDVGCGEGWWANAFANLGHRVTGVDSGRTEHRPDTFDFIEQSLTDPLPERHWDLIICLEVLEHLPPGWAQFVVDQICARTECAVISAARPGQGGTGHINEQPIGHWANMISSNGFAVSGALRWYLWGNPHVENWYQQNMLVAIPAISDGPTVGTGEMLFPPHVPDEMAFPHDVVHPVLFDARRR